MAALGRMWIIEVYELFQHAERDETVLEQVIGAQREELEQEIGELEAEAAKMAEEIEELAGEVLF